MIFWHKFKTKKKDASRSRFFYVPFLTLVFAILTNNLPNLCNVLRFVVVLVLFSKLLMKDAVITDFKYNRIISDSYNSMNDTKIFNTRFNIFLNFQRNFLIIYGQK